MSETGMTIERLTKHMRIELFLKQFLKQFYGRRYENTVHELFVIIKEHISKLNDIYQDKFKSNECRCFLVNLKSDDKFMQKYINDLIIDLYNFANSNDNEKHVLFDMISNMILSCDIVSNMIVN